MGDMIQDYLLFNNTYLSTNITKCLQLQVHGKVIFVIPLHEKRYGGLLVLLRILEQYSSLFTNNYSCSSLILKDVSSSFSNLRIMAFSQEVVSRKPHWRF